MAEESWLDEAVADKTAMAEVKAQVVRWRELRKELAEAETKFKCAQMMYDNFCQQVLSQTLRQNGLEALKCEDGTLLTVELQTRCSIKKDEASKADVAKWLREQGADNLIKSQLIVMPSAKAALDKLGIAYDEDVSMNTNSVKAYILGEMRMNNISAADLPKGLSWYQYDTISFKEPL